MRISDWSSDVCSSDLIGAPLRGFHALVLDARLRPVPPGVIGELYLGGQALARGYHGKHALNAARFAADTFGPPGGRGYRTGESGRASSGEKGVRYSEI